MKVVEQLLKHSQKNNFHIKNLEDLPIRIENNMLDINCMLDVLSEYEQPLLIKQLFEKGAEIYKISRNECYDMFITCAINGNYESFKVFLNNGGDVFKRAYNNLNLFDIYDLLSKNEHFKTNINYLEIEYILNSIRDNRYCVCDNIVRIYMKDQIVVTNYDSKTDYIATTKDYIFVGTRQKGFGTAIFFNYPIVRGIFNRGIKEGICEIETSAYKYSQNFIDRETKGDKFNIKKK